MQYKIPVQIENEDPIFLGLSLRQLSIIMIWGWIAYSIFKNLQPQTSTEIRAIPSLLILAITLLIALFKQHEMTFIPFILAILRYNINYKERYWIKWVDSYSILDIWIIANKEKKENDNINFQDKIEKIKTLEENLKKI